MQLYKSALAALAIGTLAVGGCSGTEESDLNNGGSESDSALGELGMSLVLPDDSEITSVHYEITGPSGFTRNGDVPVGNSSKLVFRVGNLPIGTGFNIALSANTGFGQTCAGSTMFSVDNNQLTTVAVQLLCTAVDNSADLLVNGSFDSCPLVTNLEAIPAEVYVGNTMSFAAWISHGDSTVTWSDNGGGTFSAVTGTGPYRTTYTCPATAGVYTVSATISGAGAACDDVLTMTVECTQNPGCGNGTVDTGEECDDGPANSNTGACTASCQNARCGDSLVWAGEEECDTGIPTATCSATCEAIVCGDGVQEGGELCDDNNTTNGDGCSSLCIPEGCGDGVIQPATEQCDNGPLNSNTAACTATCQNARCGDGFINQASEQCEGTALPTDTCSATCTTIDQPGDEAHSIAACRDCRGSGAPGAPAGFCSDIGGFGLFDAPAACFYNSDPAFIQQCVDLRNCVYTAGNGLGYGPVGAFETFCGTAPLSTCSTTFNGQPGGGNGPCIQQWYDACRLPNTTAGFALMSGSIGDLSLPCGIANALTECDATNCAACEPTP